MTAPAIILVLYFGAPRLLHTREFPREAYAGEVRESATLAERVEEPERCEGCYRYRPDPLPARLGICMCEASIGGWCYCGPPETFQTSDGATEVTK